VGYERQDQKLQIRFLIPLLLKAKCHTSKDYLQRGIVVSCYASNEDTKPGHG